MYSLIGYTFCNAGPLKLQLEIVDNNADGMRSHYIELTGSNFQGKRYSGGNWVVDKDVPSDASIRFHHRFQPELVMDFSVFKSADLIKDYSEQGLKDYVLSLRPQFAPRGLKVQGARAVKAPVGSVPFMGGTYWRIDYELAESETSETSFAVTEFVNVDEDQNNYRLRFSGPTALVKMFERNFVDEVGRFTLD